jgi:hypothetical protein
MNKAVSTIINLSDHKQKINFNYLVRHGYIEISEDGKDIIGLTKEGFAYRGQLRAEIAEEERRKLIRHSCFAVMIGAVILIVVLLMIFYKPFEGQKATNESHRAITAQSIAVNTASIDQNFAQRAIRLASSAFRLPSSKAFTDYRRNSIISSSSMSFSRNSCPRSVRQVALTTRYSWCTVKALNSPTRSISGLRQFLLTKYLKLNCSSSVNESTLTEFPSPQLAILSRTANWIFLLSITDLSTI